MDANIIASLILGACGIFMTGWLSSIAHGLAKDRMRKELFEAFNARYDKLKQDLEEIRNRYKTEDDWRKADIKEKQIYREKIFTFFNLCAEEYYWHHHKKRIGKVIWNSWHKGMKYWYNHAPALKALWEDNVISDNGEGLDSYYITKGCKGFFNPDKG